MASEAMSLAMEMQWLSQDDITLEDYSFSLKTGLRTAGERSDVLDAMEGFWTGLVSLGILNGATLRACRLNNWETSGGFTGWHQLESRVESIAGGGSSRLPTQFAVVISLLNTRESSFNIGRRRSRCYLGPLPANILDGSGKITTGNRADIEAEVAALQVDLLAASTSLSSNAGLNVVSPTQGKSMEATSYGVGLQVDTHRSRRQKAVEGINYIAF